MLAPAGPESEKPFRTEQANGLLAFIEGGIRPASLDVKDRLTAEAEMFKPFRQTQMK